MFYTTVMRQVCAASVIAILATTGAAFADSQAGAPSETSDSPKTDDTSLTDVRREAEEAMATLKTYTVEQRDEAAQQAQQAVDTLDARIDALETRVDNTWDTLDAAARARARATLRELRRQRTELAEWYGGMKSSSAAAWAEMRTGFSKAYLALSDAWERAESEFRADEQEEGTPSDTN